MRTVVATRYVTPLREGGSLPGLVEADDDGLYVVKFRGAGQGPRALVAEWLAGELARTVGLTVPDLVAIEIDPALGDAEPDEEIHDLVGKSGGLNFGMDFLPGALTFNPAAATARAVIDPDFAADVVWLDALVTNPDRSAQNPNLLVWHGRPWLIDHGAALYIHHTWRDPDEHARRPFERIGQHVLLPYADSIVTADARLASRIDEPTLTDLVAALPDAWLPDDPVAGDAAGQRRAYVRYLTLRLEAPRSFVRRRNVPEPPRNAFQYSIIRVLPRVERGESLNVGVVLLCRPARFLGARIALDETRLAAFRPEPRPGLHPAAPRSHRADRRRRRDAGPIARLGQAERFHWLVSPSSTIIQPSEVHAGLCDDPAAELDHLVATLVD
jgi:hypothetical protein